MNAGSMLVLFLAIASEVVGTVALKASEGFARLGPTMLVVVGYGLTFYLLGLALKQIPLGVAYAIWSGLGTAGAVLAGVLLWRIAQPGWRARDSVDRRWGTCAQPLPRRLRALRECAQPVPADLPAALRLQASQCSGRARGRPRKNIPGARCSLPAVCGEF